MQILLLLLLDAGMVICDQCAAPYMRLGMILLLCVMVKGLNKKNNKILFLEIK
jgi:hypothetical protein